MTKLRPFHRLFGLAWMDLLEGAPARVEPELDMATQQMLLDVAISLDNPNALHLPLPHGFDNISKHNIVTFKSYREALDDWAIQELIHHYVAHRYQVSPKDQLLPPSDFRLYAVCVRRPHLFGQLPDLTRVQDGVYDMTVLFLPIRIIVIHELPLTPENAMLQLFSARDDAIRYGISYYRNRSTETSALICRLFEEYLEDPTMPNQLKEFAREVIDELLNRMTTEERLKGVSTEELLKVVPTEDRLRGVPTEDRLKGVPTEDRLKGVPPQERLAGLSVDEVLQGLSPEAIEALSRKFKPNGTHSSQ